MACSRDEVQEEARRGAGGLGHGKANHGTACACACACARSCREAGAARAAAHRAPVAPGPAAGDHPQLGLQRIRVVHHLQAGQGAEGASGLSQTGTTGTGHTRCTPPSPAHCSDSQPS